MSGRGARKLAIQKWTWVDFGAFLERKRLIEAALDRFATFQFAAAPADL